MEESFVRSADTGPRARNESEPSAGRESLLDLRVAVPFAVANGYEEIVAVNVVRRESDAGDGYVAERRRRAARFGDIAVGVRKRTIIDGASLPEGAALLVEHVDDLPDLGVAQGIQVQPVAAKAGRRWVRSLRLASPY